MQRSIRGSETNFSSFRMNAEISKSLNGVRQSILFWLQNVEDDLFFASGHQIEHDEQGPQMGW